jgi:hypothetical protein
MSSTRASIFDDETKLDLSDFAPKPKNDVKAPPAAAVKAVAEKANFKSRDPSVQQPVAPQPSKPSSVKRAPRVHRTGRNVQFNVKASQETIDEIYAITEAHPGWVLGYTLERAVAALKRELELEA